MRDGPRCRAQGQLRFCSGSLRVVVVAVDFRAVPVQVLGRARVHYAGADAGRSPRLRGAVADMRTNFWGTRFIPARAGHGSACCRSLSMRAVHPRACGARLFPRLLQQPFGVHPRPCGVPAVSLTRVRSIPARAGRHEDRVCDLGEPEVDPPRVRGSRCQGLGSGQLGGLIPARAGKPIVSCSSLAWTGHFIRQLSAGGDPRPCGSAWCLGPRYASGSGRSPPARGNDHSTTPRFWLSPRLVVAFAPDRLSARWLQVIVLPRGGSRHQPGVISIFGTVRGLIPRVRESVVATAAVAAAAVAVRGRWLRRCLRYLPAAVDPRLRGVALRGTSTCPGSIPARVRGGSAARLWCVCGRSPLLRGTLAALRFARRWTTVQPRAGGETFQVRRLGRTPPARGSRPSLPVHRGSTPARAGKCHGDPALLVGLPPRVRGRLPRGPRRQSRPGSTPARAGQRRSRSSSSMSPRVHPRGRGATDVST